jgi:hypothetical protein
LQILALRPPLGAGERKRWMSLLLEHLYFHFYDLLDILITVCRVASQWLLQPVVAPKFAAKADILYFSLLSQYLPAFIKASLRSERIDQQGFH